MCTRSALSTSGCAFSSLTRPCVAQRVWPMPIVAGGASVAVAAPWLAARAPPRGGQVADRADGVDLAVAEQRHARRCRSRGTRACAARRGGSPAPGAADVSDNAAHPTQTTPAAPERPQRAVRRRRRSPPRSAPRPSRERAARCRSDAPARGRGPSSAADSRATASCTPSAPARAPRSRTGTLTSRCGSFAIAPRSRRSRPPSASSASSADAIAVAGGPEAQLDDVARLLAAERPAALAQRLEHVAVADRGRHHLDPGLPPSRSESRSWSSR